MPKKPTKFQSRAPARYRYYRPTTLREFREARGLPEPTTELVSSFRPINETTYRAALELVAVIDKHLTRETRHYYTKSGLLLTTLNEVVQAILTDNLATEEQGVEITWVRPMELEGIAP